MKKDHFLIVSCLFLASFICNIAYADVQYEIIDLGDIGATELRTEAINNNGQVVGKYTNSTGYHAFLWSNNSFTDLGGYQSHALDINDYGQIVGWARPQGDPYNRAFVWENGTMTYLVSSGNFTSEGQGINNNGEIVGTSDGSPFTWSQQSGMQSLPFRGRGRDINENGEWAGSIIDGTCFHPYINGLELWAGNAAPCGMAQAINDVGQAVGYLGGAWIWDNVNGVQGLPSLNGGITVAEDINNSGQVVGNSGGKAVLWDSGLVADLNSLIDPSLGWNLQTAESINDLGQITGWGRLSGGERSFILTPVAVIPEPISSVLFVAGGAFLIGRRYIVRK